MSPESPTNPAYSRHHPKWHRSRMPIFWWLGDLAYTRFIVRELTSLGVLYAAALLVAQAVAVGRGEASYERFLEWLGSPWVLAVHGLLLLVLLFHTVTWLGLAPKALVLRVRGRRLPDAAIVTAHYAAWIAISAAVVWYLGGI